MIRSSRGKISLALLQISVNCSVGTAMLLPAGKTTETVIEEITGQIRDTCDEHGIEIIGGHTEITSGLERPILIGTMMGEISPDRLITPGNVQIDDRILLTKGVPLEATAILSREFPERLEQTFSSAEIQTAREFLFDPGISVLRDATLACQAGNVTGMHDPTEGGLYAALWELAQACGHTLAVYQESINVYQISRRICDLFDIDPLGAIASGSLLLTVDPADADKVCNALKSEGIPCAEIGTVKRGDPAVVHPDREDELYPYPDRDEITKAYE